MLINLKRSCFLSDLDWTLAEQLDFMKLLSVSVCVCLSAAPKFYLVSARVKHLTRICIIQQSVARHAHSLHLAFIHGHSASLIIFTACFVHLLALFSWFTARMVLGVVVWMADAAAWSRKWRESAQLSVSSFSTRGDLGAASSLHFYFFLLLFFILLSADHFLTLFPSFHPFISVCFTSPIFVFIRFSFYYLFPYFFHFLLNLASFCLFSICIFPVFFLPSSPIFVSSCCSSFPSLSEVLLR